MKRLDIKRALSEHNMTQADLYQKIGMSPQAICMIIKNNNPTVAKLMQIAEGIGCDITDLFYPDPTEEAEGKEKRDREMEQEREKALESAKDSKMPLELILRDLARRAYPSITQEEVKELVEAIKEKKGIQKFDVTPKMPRRLADMIDFEATRKKHEDETLNAEIQGDLASENQQQMIQTSTFCPHCGKKVRVGVVLLDSL